MDEVSTVPTLLLLVLYALSTAIGPSRICSHRALATGPGSIHVCELLIAGVTFAYFGLVCLTIHTGVDPHTFPGCPVPVPTPNPTCNM